MNLSQQTDNGPFWVNVTEPHYQERSMHLSYNAPALYFAKSIRRGLLIIQAMLLVWLRLLLARVSNPFNPLRARDAARGGGLWGVKISASFAKRENL